MGKRTWKATLMVLCLAVVVMTGSLGISYGAEAALMPSAVNNLNAYLIPSSGLVATDSGYVRVFYDDGKVGIEQYDDSFRLLSKKTMDMELPYWGGFYAGSDGYYLIQGQSNTAESDSTEVIRVIKYDRNWNRLGAAGITPDSTLWGGEVRYPFDAGCVEVAEYNGKLYIVTGHEGYVDAAYNQGHQGMLMIEVDMAAMEGAIVSGDYWHSFAQYIKNVDDQLYVLELSEGSRYTALTKYDADTLESTTIPVLEYGGSRTSAWAVACYASVNGLAVSDSHILGLGTSIDQSQYDTVTEDTPHNLYLTVTPQDNFTKEATTVKWLTDFTGNGTSFVGAKITKFNDDRFMISWEVKDETGEASVDDTLSEYIHHYCFVDGEGNQIGGEYTAKAPLSDCQPIVKNGKAIYYAANGNMVNFYTIDGETGAFDRRCYRVAGERATWTLNGNVLTISGTGALGIDAEANPRNELSSTATWSSYSSSDNCWKPVRDNVKKIVIEEGLTSIPEQAFRYFDNVTEVIIEEGLLSIGAEAFRSCDGLSVVNIPASVTSIGTDAFWSGYYRVSDDSHIIYATIKAPSGSYAETYAIENLARFVSTTAPAPEGTNDGITGDTGNTDSAGNTTGNTSGGASENPGSEHPDNPTTGGSGIQNTAPALQVGAPKTLKVRLAKGDYDGIYASWSAVQVSGETVKYKVQYRYGTGKWKTVAKATTKKSWTLKKLEDGRKVTVRVTPFVVSDGVTYTGKAKTSTAVYTLKKLNQPVVKKVAKNRVKVSWKNISGETGYEIYRSEKKAKGFKFAKRVKGTKVKSATLKTTKGRKLYYKVRAYKNIQIGKKTYRVYGPWSKVREFKLK